MHGYFNDMRQDYNIGRAEAKASSASRKVEDIQFLLERKIDKLSLITQALWALVSEFHSVPEDALIAKIREIDMQDGVLDGKVNKGPAKKCHECGRVMNKMHNKCLYCGAAGLMDTAFDGV